jgi:hypothetical protein
VVVVNNRQPQRPSIAQLRSISHQERSPGRRLRLFTRRNSSRILWIFSIGIAGLLILLMRL